MLFFSQRLNRIPKFRLFDAALTKTRLNLIICIFIAIRRVIMHLPDIDLRVFLVAVVSGKFLKLIFDSVGL